MKTKKARRLESMKAAYERCLREYHESEFEVIAAQSSDKMDRAGFLGESEAENHPGPELPVTDVRTGGGSGVG